MLQLLPTHSIHHITFLFTGDRSVGKTSVISRYCDNHFVGAKQTYLDFGVRKMKVGDQIVRVQLWDSSQQMDDEKSNSFCYRFYRSANAIIFVYDISLEESFTCIRDMYTITSRFCHPGLPILLIGNKSDLRICKVSRSDTREFTDDIKNITVAEVSALKNSNLRETISTFVHRIITDGPVPETYKTLQLTKEPENTQPSIKKILCSCWT